MIDCGEAQDRALLLEDTYHGISMLSTGASNVNIQAVKRNWLMLYMFVFLGTKPDSPFQTWSDAFSRSR